MNTALDCIPCFVRQALEAARFITDDVATHETVMREVLRTTATMDLAACPPVAAQKIHRRLRELTGNRDPYVSIKARFNNVILELLPELTRETAQSANPLSTAARYAIAGNVIDVGTLTRISEAGVRRAIAQTLTEPFHGDMAAFREAIEQAQRIFYLADNTGEIVLDKLLIEQLGPERVTVAVRGAPVLNDATLEDAQAVGLTQMVRVISNGSDAPGTLLHECSEIFLRHYAEADLIIAKGQGNYESLSDAPGNIYFLFKVKCPVVAAHTGLAEGTHVLIPSARISMPAHVLSAASAETNDHKPQDAEGITP